MDKDQAPIYLSEIKKKELEIELLHRKTTLRSEISERLISARELGDLKENAEYHTARDEQGKNESRIREIDEVLKRAQILEKIDTGAVSFGSTITIKKKGSDSSRVFTLVDVQEADMAQGKISLESPLGSALIDRKIGDFVAVSGPHGIIEYEIMSIE